ncbi:MAG: sugar transferase [Candidatus Liptonbacteria bacterium]
MRVFLLLLGDLMVLYASLALTVLLRYGEAEWLTRLIPHLLPFSGVFAIWLIIFYIAGLYDFRKLRNRLDFFQVLSASLLINTLLAILFFYFTRASGITPKTNLVVFLVLFFILETLWRQWFNFVSRSLRPVSRVVLLGENSPNEELYRFLKENPQLGYEVRAWVQASGDLPAQAHSWEELARSNSADMLVIPRNILRDHKLKKTFPALVESGVEIKDLPTFYESVFRKVPLSEIDEEWFLEHITGTHDIYELLKRGVDFGIALITQIIFLPFEIIIVPLVKLTSAGPVIYRQVRAGRHGHRFVLYKFRRMYNDKAKNPDADSSSPIWSPPVGDSRETPVGKFLRASHLDELPQLLNILKGDMSFVGPRPERPELIQKIKNSVPYYEMRSLIKPGLTGWAQIHHPKDATAEDVKEKLSYDLYYLKNRSFIIDVAIILKTIKVLFVNPGR